MDNETETLYEGNHLRLRKRDRWEFAERTRAAKAVVIIAITPQDEILLVEQHRLPMGSTVVELPAGLVGDDAAEETVLEAAARELTEETGYKANSLKFLTGGPISPGLGNEIIDFVLAKDLVRVGEGGGVGGENITVHSLPLQEAKDSLVQMSRKQLVDPKVFCGLLFAQE